MTPAHLVALSRVHICALGRAFGVVGAAEHLHHRSETHILAQLAVHVLVALVAFFFFFLQVTQLLTGPITPELCFLLVAFQRFVPGMLRMASLEPQPDALPQFEATLHSVFQYQLELGLLRTRRATRPVASVCMRVFVFSPQRQLRITHCKICWTAVRRWELRFLLASSSESGPKYLVTHSKEHIEECACHLSEKQCQSWPVMDRSPRSATSETPAMAQGTNGSSAV